VSHAWAGIEAERSHWTKPLIRRHEKPAPSVTSVRGCDLCGSDLILRFGHDGYTFRCAQHDCAFYRPADATEVAVAVLFGV
jgi:hypothetical protein